MPTVTSPASARARFGMWLGQGEHLPRAAKDGFDSVERPVRASPLLSKPSSLT